MRVLDYDLIAVGGGTAGLVSSAGGAYMGARVALLEKRALGGDCLWTGCVPSKALIASARLARDMREAGELGLIGSAQTHSFDEVMKRMRRVRETVARHDDPERFRKLGVDVHFGAAHFLGPGLLEVEEVGRIRSRRIILATGASPDSPSIRGLEETGYLTHMTVFDQSALPGAISILGGGPVGVELAQVYRRLGAEVTVVEAQPRILPREDPDVSETLQRVLEQEGVRVRKGAEVVRVRREGAVKILEMRDGSEVRGDELLVATGRRPSTSELDLGRAGIEVLGPAVRVDRWLRTTGAGVWAAGDVTGGLQFTHQADNMARIAVRNALLPFRRRFDDSGIPRVTYTDPEVARIGFGQMEGEARGGVTYRYPFRDLDRSILEGETEGFVKITADRRGRILGASIVGRGAGDLLLPLALAKKHGIRLSEISDTVFPYPTRAEGLRRTADSYQRRRLEGAGGRLLRKIVSWLK